MAVNMGSAVAYLELDTSKFTTGFARAAQDLKVFRSDTATTSQKLKGLSGAMQSTGSVLTKTVTLPLLGIGAAAIKTTMDFEAGMSQVQAISGATGADMDKLNKKALDMGAKTKFSASESADAFKYMAMAGWDTADMLDGIEGVMDLAAASGEDLAMTSDIVTDSLTAFGLQAKDSGHFADVLAQASSRSNTNVGLLGETFKYVAPVAGALGYSVEDTAVAIGLMANAGIKGSQAGTALRSTFTRLAKPTKQVATAMEKYGISITDTEGNMKPLNTTIVELRDKFKGLSEAEKANLAATLAGQEGMSGLLAIVNASEDDFQKLTKEINNADGAAERMADTMMDNTAGAVEQLKGAAETAGITIGKRLTPYIKDGTKFVTNLTDKFNKLSDEQLDLVVNIAKVVAAVGPALLVGSKVLNLLTPVVKGLSLVKTAMFTAIPAISAFTQALNYSKIGMTYLAEQTSPLYKNLTNLKGGFMGVLTSIKGLLTPTNLLIAGVGALTALVIVDVKQREKRIEKLAEETEAEKYLSDAIDKQHENYTKMQETRTQAIESAGQEAEVTKSLAEKLKSVTDENGNVLAGKEVYAEFIRGELSEALGQEIEIVDGQVQQYGKLMGTIDEVIQKQQALAIQEAMHDSYTEAIKNQTSAQANYADRLSEVAEKEDALTEATKNAKKAKEEADEETANGTGQIDKYMTALNKANEAEEAARRSLKKSKESMEKAKESLIGYNETVENYEGLSAAIIEGDAEKIDIALLKIQQGFITANTGTRDALEDQANTVKTQYENMQKALNDGVEGITQDMVDNIKTLSDAAQQELQAKIESDKQLLITKFTETGLQVPDALVTTLASKDPETQKAIIDMLTNMQNGAQLKKADLQSLFKKIGIDAPNDLITAISSKDPETQKSVISMLTNVQNGAQLKKQDIETLFKQLGIQAPDNLSAMLAAKEPSVQSRAINLLQQLQNAEASKRPVILAQLQELGILMDTNLAEGIESKTGTVVNQAGEVGDKANKKIAEKVKPDVDAPKVKDIDNAERVAREAHRTIASILSEPIAVVVDVIRNITETVQGKHANGLDYVPKDNYVAMLHEGERVLTKQENKRYNDGRGAVGNGGDVFNFYNTQPSPYEYARQMKKAKKEILQGF